MNTSSRFIVGLHILAGMAARAMSFPQDEDPSIKSDDMALSVNTNPVVIRRILGMLQKAGLVHSKKGRNGGSRLAQAPTQITLLDVYNAVEDEGLFHMHYADPNPYCPIGCNIQDAVIDVFSDAETSMKQVLSTRTLAEVTSDIIDRSGLQARIDAGATFEELRSEFLFGKKIPA